MANLYAASGQPPPAGYSPRPPAATGYAPMHAQPTASYGQMRAPLRGGNGMPSPHMLNAQTGLQPGLLPSALASPLQAAPHNTPPRLQQHPLAPYQPPAHHGSAQGVNPSFASMHHAAHGFAPRLSAHLPTNAAPSLPAVRRPHRPPPPAPHITHHVSPPLPSARQAAAQPLLPGGLGGAVAGGFGLGGGGGGLMGETAMGDEREAKRLKPSGDTCHHPLMAPALNGAAIQSDHRQLDHPHSGHQHSGHQQSDLRLVTAPPINGGAILNGGGLGVV